MICDFCFLCFCSIRYFQNSFKQKRVKLNYRSKIKIVTFRVMVKYKEMGANDYKLIATINDKELWLKLTQVFALQSENFIDSHVR